MSAATSLMQALLAPGSTPQDAYYALDQAFAAQVDPLHWCAVHLGVSDAEIMRRVADWAGLSFLDAVPRIDRLDLAPARLESLAEVRIYRTRLPGRDVLFAAPDFYGVLRLRAAQASRPHLSRILCLVPATAFRTFIVDQAGQALLDGARQTMARRWPRAAAQLDLTRWARWTFAIMLMAVTGLLLVAPLWGWEWFAPIWLALVVVPALLRLAALCSPPDPELAPVVPPTDDSDLPIYSVLVPLRDEASMVGQLHAALAKIDYPPEKLEVMFVVEAVSASTIAAVKRHLVDARFSLVVVPDAAPRTKPKALAFALPLCRGEFLVVYDAEDRPEPDQLRRVIDQFRRDPDLACIQARLVIDNGGAIALPSLFAGEYAGLFAVLLPALARWGFVMPLGGTSNHFRTDVLRELGGWDAFNVTEDADLGVRLARRGLRCGTSVSATYETAPTTFSPWLGQRTRWMKGWMQTYAVHNRHSGALVRDLGLRGWAMFQVVLLGMILAPLLHAGFLLVLFVHLLRGEAALPMAELWPIACLFVLVTGHACAVATNLVGLHRTGQRHLWLWQVLLPAYWLLIAFATLRAMREFVRRPFHWFKSPHSAGIPEGRPLLQAPPRKRTGLSHERAI
ncbi:Glycosyltransferase, catalytic subunit of cellulose synthase and poly-beta-1,6-N-acetylglucosamine synthase [Devosia lucknowensis]|uniref:Glycosyltransferase, catalytic subunit of cellulose synthase and poly-beta-1,6-N-acetylglucosamine synthase n=1 Tax=Devosia lucknowensis TaxID=1096929 RepID=A0A1Y6GBT9_9HYPH|nr:glycosyltransferase [Devosia lucknowensis]SMQ85250.1 Glycosyltransferase, catalytic subunit of cellulose synthase and poly-beta-1,6-N-acetylglucosamine synthase [Devosia lucknowensis]